MSQPSATHPDGAVSFQDRDGIRTIVLDRPEKKNAMTEVMWIGLGTAFATAASAGNRVVLVTGRGATFCAGNDLRDFLEHPPKDENAPVFRCLLAMATLELPLIAAVRGPAVGIGTTLLLHCDLVYAAPGAKLKVPFVDLGLVPEAGSSLLLPRRIGRARAGAMLLLGETISAEQAHADGIITRIVPDENLDTEAQAAAAIIAAKPRQAVLETKRLLNHDRADLLAAIHREAASFCRLLETEEARTAIAGFFRR
ncbi:MAG: enoyl-CoA hydratase-related protein [Rhodocyclaceae bacterium]|nr:enoyl-CoA hydratase-related protein [Rhodocyclaceae bacterium]